MLLKVKNLPVGTPKSDMAQMTGQLLDVHLRGKKGINCIVEASDEKALRAEVHRLFGRRVEVTRLPPEWVLQERLPTAVVNVAVLGLSEGRIAPADEQAVKRAVQHALHGAGLGAKIVRVAPHAPHGSSKGLIVMVEFESARDSARLLDFRSGILDAERVELAGGGCVFLYGDQCQQRKKRIFTPGRGHGRRVRFQHSHGDEGSSSSSAEHPGAEAWASSEGYGAPEYCWDTEHGRYDQAYSSQAYPDHVYFDHVYPDHVYPDHVCPDHVYSGQVCSDHVYSGQVCSDQAFSAANLMHAAGPEVGDEAFGEQYLGYF